MLALAPAPGAPRRRDAERGCDVSEHALPGKPRAPEIVDADAADALGEPRSVRGRDERDVREARRRSAQKLREQDLSRRREKQIRAAHHLGDTHGQIVHHDRELVSENAIAPADDEIADRAEDVLRDRALERVGEGDVSIGHREAHRGRPLPRARGHPERPAGARIPRSLFAGVGRARGSRDVRARTVAQVDEPRRGEPIHGLCVARRSLRLAIRPERAPLPRTFVGVEPEPREIVVLRSSHPGTTRGVSRSSTRTTKVPFAARALSHATSAAASEPKVELPRR